MSRPVVGLVAALLSEAASYAGAPCMPRGPHRVGGNHLVYVCGIGPEAAENAARALVDAGATALVSWGTAGALDGALRRGTLMLPETVHAPAGRIAVHGPWRAALQGRLAGHLPLHAGPLGHTGAVLATAAIKAETFAASAVHAVDMESAGVAQVAREHALPCLVIRAIADEASVTIPHAALAAVDLYGRPDWARLAGALVRRPWDLHALLRLGAGYRAGLAALRRASTLGGFDLALPAPPRASVTEPGLSCAPPAPGL